MIKKALICVPLAAVMLTGCAGDYVPDNPVFGAGEEYTLGELSFRTEHQVTEYSAYELWVEDGDYVIKMTYSPLQQNETDVYEDVKHIIESREALWDALVQSTPEATCSTETQRKSARIDGYNADAVMYFIQTNMPQGYEYYDFQQFFESAKITTDKYSYTITYVGYTEEDIKLDMQYLKERAQNIYYGIEINPDVG